MDDEEGVYARGEVVVVLCCPVSIFLQTFKGHGCLDLAPFQTHKQPTSIGAKPHALNATNPNLHRTFKSHTDIAKLVFPISFGESHSTPV